MTMGENAGAELMERIIEKARSAGKTLVLPESDDERVIRAAALIRRKGIARVILLGKPDEVRRKAQELGVRLDDVEIVDHRLEDDRRTRYVKSLVELRKHKGMTEDEAGRLLDDPLYYAVMMIKEGDADCEVAGSLSPTGDVLRPAFQIIKTAPGISLVSGAFIMISPATEYGVNGVMLFADCAVNPTLDARQMAEVAVCSARTCRALCGFEPIVAMLSFSTKGSAEHELVDKVREATRIAAEMEPDLLVDGELQADAALVPSVGAKKAPGSPVAGKANVLIFPDLQSANIGYKLVQRLGKAEAIGPVLQGLAAPINDLSRGCSVEDIVNTSALAVVQSLG